MLTPLARPPAEYRITKNKENPDICTITFSSGPPYEDIAFTIVNKQWEHSHKRGFRSSFDRGVLQLHFSFRCVPPSRCSVRRCARRADPFACPRRRTMYRK